MRKFWPLLALCLAAILSGAPANRLARPIDSRETYVLSGHSRPLLVSAKDLGPAAASLPLGQLELHFSMTAAQTADLDSLLAQQRDRRSSQYHKWLTPEQFGARFGVSESDLNKVTAWLESAGFENVQVSRSRTFVSMSGTAAHVGNLFGAAIHQYQRNGKAFYANSADPVLPRALSGLVSGLKGLSNYQARPFISHRLAPQIGIGINGNHFLAPNDLATIYDLQTLYNQGVNGTGQNIVIVGQSDISLQDISAFQTAAGLTVKSPQVILAGSDPGYNADSASEADLDLEWAGGIARGANILYVNSKDVLNSATYAIEHNLAQVISISYGLCEAAMSAADMDAYNATFKQATAQGITIVVASGDTGAASCDVDQNATQTPESAASLGLAVSFPASSPYVTAVGGTEFDEAQGNYWSTSGNALSYIPEISWNDTKVWGALSGSGGGASVHFAKPDWQVGTGVPADSARDVPDVALSASASHDPYLICTGGSCSNGFQPPVSQLYFVGGTSCAAPVFAGILALLNQSTNSSQGNVNGALYALASFNSGVFHDVVLGDNKVPCVADSPNCTGAGNMGFSAGAGYDQVTGLGSVDATQLVEQWGSDFQVTANPLSVSMSSGSSASVGIQITRYSNFNGSVSLSCSVAGSLGNTNCSITQSVQGSGPVTLTLSNSAIAGVHKPFTWLRSLPPGAAFSMIGGAIVLSILIGRKRPMVLAGFTALGFLVVAGCGSGSTSTAKQPLSGNAIVTASSGVLSRTVTIPVTIQ